MDIDKIDLVVHLNVRNPKAFVNRKYLLVGVHIVFACNIVVRTFAGVVDTFDVVGTFVAVGMLVGLSLMVIVLAAVVVRWLYLFVWRWRRWHEVESWISWWLSSGLFWWLISRCCWI